MKRTAYLLTMVVVLMALVACGYSFRGGKSNLPSDVKTVAIPTFANNSTELRIDAVLTDNVIYEFTKSGTLKVVSEGKADAILKGTIDSIYTSDVALTRAVTSRQRRVLITVSGQLIRSRDKKVLWKGRGISEFRTFTVTNDPPADEAAKQRAMGEAAEELAQTLHDRVLENF